MAVPRTLVCTEWDEVMQECVTESWTVLPTWADMLPTVEQANLVGGSMLTAVALVMAMGLLLPPRDDDD